MSNVIYISIPAYLSDLWIENNHFRFVSKEKQSLALDFSESEWIELSALVSITGLIIQNIKSFDKIDILFAVDLNNQSKDHRNAFLFLIDSNFFIALNKAAIINNCPCSLWFKLNPEKYDLITIQEKLALNFSLTNLSRDEINKIFPIVPSKKDNHSLLGIVLQRIQKNLKIDISSFSIFGYRPEKQRDQFIIPIKYYSTKELKTIGKEKDLLTFVQNELFNELDIKNVTEYVEKKETFNDIQRVYLVELISNIIEHSGDNSDALIALRLGNWEHRSEKYINGIEYWGECYNYKIGFFEANKERIGEKFIDLHVLDTGEGFSTLKPYYESYRKNQNAPLISIHRYALFPHTSSKKRQESAKDEDTLRITGLGVIAENIILHNGLISIKDRKELTYFDSTSLKFISNSGKIESKSVGDMKHTYVSLLIPISDETWLKDNYVRRVEIRKTIKDHIVVFKASKIKPLEFNTFILFDTNTKQNSTKQFKELYKIEAGLFCIIDISNISNVFDKNISIKLRDFVLVIRKLGFIVLLFGGNVSTMKILQATIDSYKKLIDLNILNLFTESIILCPILTPDFKIFFCGFLDTADRPELFEFFNKDKPVSTSTFQLIREWSQNKNYIPFSSIERCINLLRGIEFKNDIEKSHYYKGIIQDIHGDYLDSFYEVKSYFSHNENRVKWKDDFIRIVSIYDPEIIIVDSPELRLLLTEVVIELNFETKVVRINNKTIEFSKIEISNNTKVLIILSCAYSGSVLESIPEYRKKYKLDKVNTITILDLTGKRRSEIEKLINGSYDRFSVGLLPKRLNKKGLIPDYLVTSRARLVPMNVMRREYDVIFRPYIPSHSQLAALHQSSQIYMGHTIEHEHHYDLFIDVRAAILFNDRLSQHLRNLVQTQINLGREIIIYPEDSELDPILNSVKYAPGNRKIYTFPIRRVDDETFVWSNLSHKNFIEGKRIIFLDEGIYSCISLLGIVKLLLKESPAIIDVIVLEKRLSYEISTINFSKAFQPEIGKCKLNFFCIIEILAPAFNTSNCPYCKIGIPVQLNKPRLVSNSLIIGDELILYDYEHALWLLSNIYYSRDQAILCIEQLNSIFHTNVDSYYYILDLFIIHHEIILRWNLYRDLFDAAKKMFSYENILPVVNILRHVKLSDSSFRIKFIENLIHEIIYRIDNTYIFYELSDILLKSPDLIPLINNKIGALILPDKIQVRWDLIKDQNENEKVYRAVNYLYMVTKINKSKPHTTFAQDIIKDGIDNQEIRIKIQILKDIINLLEPTPPVVTKLSGVIYNDINALPNLFSNPTFLVQLVEQYSVPSDKLLQELNSIVSKTNPLLDFSKLIRSKPGDIFEIPLICIQKTQYSLLKTHFKDNVEYGDCYLSYEKINDEISISCTCDEPKKVIKSEVELETQSKKNINNILKPYGGNLKYLSSGKKFTSVLTLKIVDYGKYDTPNM